MKKHMTKLREEILSRCHVGDEEDGENVDNKVVHEEGDFEVEVKVRHHEDEIRDHVHKGFDLNSESDVGQFGEVSALQVIVPYDPQQPSIDALGVDLMKLYNIVTFYSTPYRVVTNINGQIFGTSECWGFGPANKVDNLVVLFGGSTMMYFERRKYRHVKRITFNLLYVTHVLHDSRKMKVKRRQWTLKDYQAYFRTRLISVEDILDADFLKCKDDEHPKFEAQWDITHIQPNLYDCGIIVLQMMKLWDGEKKFDGNSMPNYTNEQLR
ncbi:hypothetical protein DEO72_LG2g3191 [Vigna unguiculata]|uniref:Ulp1 protease family n=1 Tax=Vigna unguiculata TaxID=3917 RepID=A0A4D6L308_VIGUN|nr:hypothetical protein DEO72_LG2g3191 [Vigna unguiculata]